jgi:hypothetical protein
MKTRSSASVSRKVTRLDVHVIGVSYTMGVVDCFNHFEAPLLLKLQGKADTFVFVHFFESRAEITICVV